MVSGIVSIIAAGSLRNPKPVHDPLPLHFGLLEIDQQTDGPAGGFQIIQALRDVLVSEAIHALQFDYQHVFDEDVSKLFPDAVSFVNHGKGSLRRGSNAAKRELSQQSALVNFLQESSTKGIRNLKYGIQHALSQGIVKSAFISGQNSVFSWDETSQEYLGR